MSQAPLRVPLPTSVDTLQVNSARYACIGLLGTELCAKTEPVLVEAYGPDWPSELAALYGSPGQRASRDDAALILKEVIGRARSGRPAPRRVTRKVLPADPDWIASAERVLAIRNVVMHYGNEALTQTLADTEQLTYFAREAGLRCAAECAALLQRLHGLRDGTWTDDAADTADEARARAHAQAELLRELDRLREEDAVKSRRIDELAAAAARHAQQGLEAEAELVTLRAQQGVKDSQIAQLEAAARARDERAAHDAAELADLRAELAARDAIRQTPPAPPPSADAAARAAPGPPPQSTDELIALLEDRVRRQRAMQGAEQLEVAPVAPPPFPDAGQPWPYTVGTQRWKLSKQHRTLTAHDGSDLSDMVGDDLAEELVDQFLAIRPEGGKVFVDDDLDAVTWVEGRWVYLGRLEDEAIGSDPSPGTVLPGHPPGRKYRMLADGSIRAAAGGITLTNVQGAAIAAAVADRVRAVKPSGGVLWVDPHTGLMTAKVGHDTVVVTSVSRQDWFPAHLR